MIKRDLVDRVHSFVKDGLIEEALDFLEHEIGSIAPYRYVDVVMLKSRYNIAKNDYVRKGILERDEFERAIAHISYAILDIVKQSDYKFKE